LFISCCFQEERKESRNGDQREEKGLAKAVQLSKMKRKMLSDNVPLWRAQLCVDRAASH
jgi:hypothetical protein